MIDVVETLLIKGASITAVDSKGLSPALSCAANEDVATCLAMILSVFLATPANSEARRSICSISSLRLSDSSFSLTSRLSEASDTTFTVNNSNVNGVIADASVISTNELSRSQIMAVQSQSHDQASDPSMHQSNPNPKKVQASNTTIS